MLLAHGPLGILIAWKILSSSRSFAVLRKQQWLFLFVGFLGGLFPDIDLLYTYLVDARVSHREFYTHSFFIYLAVFIVCYALCVLTKRPVWMRMLFLVFFLGVTSHLLSDAIGYQMILFIRVFKVRIILLILLGVFWIFGSVGIVYFFQHILHTNANFAYADYDKDTIRNRYDEDLDGDGIVNSRDADSDDDGLSNIEEFSIAAEKIRDIWFDPSDGKWLEIPARLGFASVVDVVAHVYYEAGVPLFPEMQADFFVTSEGYISPPTDAYFDTSVQNVQAWLAHTHRLLPGDTRDLKVGDILFFNASAKAHVAVVKQLSSDAGIVLLEAHSSHGASPILYEGVRKREGDPTAVGRLLYPVLFDVQY